MPLETPAQFDVSLLFDVILLTFLLVTALAVVTMRHLFSIAMVWGAYSLLSAVFFLNLDAVDVAFTEAAVGAGISTVLFLGALMLTARTEKLPKGRQPLLPLLVVMVTGAALIYATWDMPDFGDPDAPAHQYVGMDYMDRTPHEIGVPNVVTAILASYRGYDTLGEVVVIFTAGLGVLVILGLASGVAVNGSRSNEEEGP
jgi:multicomponent Na+:H+ antiporter subunit B